MTDDEEPICDVWMLGQWEIRPSGFMAGVGLSEYNEANKNGQKKHSDGCAWSVTANLLMSREE